MINFGDLLLYLKRISKFSSNKLVILVKDQYISEKCLILSNLLADDFIFKSIINVF